jgi:phosphoribosylformylglycinamidine cyclo-ligase
MDDPVPGTDQSVRQVLLEPTRIYAKAVRHVLNHYKVKSVVHGIAHITGGGLAENLERILPPHIDLQLDRANWSVPPVFPWLQQLGEVEPAEMDRVFNMGVGLVMICSGFYANGVRQRLEQAGFSCFEMGTAVAGTGKVRFAQTL